MLDFEPYPLTCPGCGEDLILEVPFGASITIMREPNGRTTYRLGGLGKHQCRDGTFAP